MLRQLDPLAYVSEGFYQRERTSVWSTQWLLAAVTNELQKPGEYVARSIAGWPVLIRRNADHQLTAFLNVCPHRGGPIAWPGEGRIGNLVCRYHGWAFDSDGRLLSARDFGDQVCADEHSLTPLSVDEWGPLVFVNLNPSPHALLESLGGLVALISRLDFERFVHVRRISREIDCNWKTYVDNYLEAYHVPLIHPLLGAAIDIESYTIDIPEPSFCVHSARTAEGAPNSGLWVFRYPNIALNVYPGAMNVERIEPIDHARTRIVYDYFTNGDTDDDISAMLHLSNVTLDEDQAMVEVVQANLDSGAYRPGPLSPRHEMALHWFQNRIRTDVEETT